MLAIGNCLRLFWLGAPSALYASFDTGWIIQTGNYILKYGAPQHDLFSWTCPNQVFVAYQWLFELGAALTFRLGGLWLVGLSACLITGTLYLYILPRMWISRGVPPALPFLFLAFVLTPHWFNARPQLLSYILILIFVKLLEHYRITRRPQVLIMLPPLMILWANLHLFCSIGLILIAIYCVGNLFIPKHQVRFANLWLPLTLLVSATMLLVNPYGFQLITYFFTFTNGTQYMGMYEVKPSLSFSDAIFVLGYLAVTWRILWRKKQYVPIEGWMVVALVTIAAVLVRRYESIAVLLTWPYLGMALARFNWRRFRYLVTTTDLTLTINRFRDARFLQLLAALLASTITWIMHCPSQEAASDLYTEGSAQLIRFVKGYTTHDDRLFNDPTTGDWLICFEAAPVFVDTRYDMYPKLFCEDIFACVYGAPGGLAYIRSYGANHVLVRDDFGAICTNLAKSPDWQLLCDDGTLSFWARNDPAEDKRMLSAKINDSSLRDSEMKGKLLEMTIQRRAYKYLVMAKQCDASHSEQALALLKRGLALLPNSPELLAENKRRMNSKI